MIFFNIIRQGAIILLLPFSLLSAFSVHAQKLDSLNGQQVMVLSNDKLDLMMSTKGGAFMSLIMKDDPTRLSPYHTGLGHFVAVDGFGDPSADERKAGLPGHGEANLMPLKVISSGKTDQTFSISFTATLPIVQEVYRRTIHMVDGENVVYVESEIESLLGFDRPVSWGEHVSIGPPFLELGKTVVEMSAKKGMTRSFASQSRRSTHRLADYKEFTWPMAPGINGGFVDVRVPPTAAPIGDHTTSLMDPSRRLVFVTAFHAEKRMLLGYIFRREEYPWLQLWEEYPANGKLARGLEFAVQPFDLPRREIITQNSLFDTPTYRWLPAKSKIGSAFLMFWVQTPEGMTKVDDVTLENGKIVIEDRAASKKIILNASRGL